MSTAPAPEDLLGPVLKLLDNQDNFAAIELLESIPSSQAAGLYEKAQLEVYWTRKDLASVVALSQAGIQQMLGAALRADDPEFARTLRGEAKALAYNLASFTWPGWDEPDIVLTPADLKIGKAAARLNLRLAEALDRPQKALANAHWALGAHDLAAGNLAHAKGAFLAGKTHAARGGETLLEQMLEGYARLVDVLNMPDDVDAKLDFDATVAALNQEASEDARDFAIQLVVAHSVFCR